MTTLKTKTIKKAVVRFAQVLNGLVFSVMTFGAYAGLPTPDAKAKSIGSDGDWLSVLLYNAEKLSQILILIVGFLALLGTTYIGVQKFRQCQKGQADWAELFVLGATGAGVLLLIVFLLGDAGKFIQPS